MSCTCRSTLAACQCPEAMAATEPHKRDNSPPARQPCLSKLQPDEQHAYVAMTIGVTVSGCRWRWCQWSTKWSKRDPPFPGSVAVLAWHAGSRYACDMPPSCILGAETDSAHGRRQASLQLVTCHGSAWQDLRTRQSVLQAPAPFQLPAMLQLEAMPGSVRGGSHACTCLPHTWHAACTCEPSCPQALSPLRPSRLCEVVQRLLCMQLLQAWPDEGLYRRTCATPCRPCAPSGPCEAPPSSPKVGARSSAGAPEKPAPRGPGSCGVGGSLAEPSVLSPARARLLLLPVLWPAASGAHAAGSTLHWRAIGRWQSASTVCSGCKLACLASPQSLLAAGDGRALLLAGQRIPQWVPSKATLLAGPARRVLLPSRHCAARSLLSALHMLHMLHVLCLTDQLRLLPAVVGPWVLEAVWAAV